MQEMTMPESRARLGYLISEMLSLPNLPQDLHTAVTAHLEQQWALVNVLKPEYCLRLYPVLAELAELEARAEAAPATDQTPVGEAPAEEEAAEPEINTEAAPAADEVQAAEATAAPDQASAEVAPEAPVETEPEEDSKEAPAEVPSETGSEEDSAEAGAEVAEAATGRTLW